MATRQAIIENMEASGNAPRQKLAIPAAETSQAVEHPARRRVEQALLQSLEASGGAPPAARARKRNRIRRRQTVVPRFFF